MRELGAIEQRIKDDATTALKAGDKRRREACNSFVAALKKERIDSRKQPSEADELTVLKRERKRRAEAIELYDGAGRSDLADQERYEEELLKGYMPEELGDACAFLCSAQAGFISGQNLGLDGGSYAGLI